LAAMIAIVTTAGLRVGMLSRSGSTKPETVAGQTDESAVIGTLGFR
jgi:hypothetical protein